MQIYETMPISVIAAELCRQPGDIYKKKQKNAATNPDDDGFFFPCAFIPYFHIHILHRLKQMERITETHNILTKPPKENETHVQFKK
jgi:hypothetical protein